MTHWFIFLGMLGPMAALMVGMIIAQHLSLFRSTESARPEQKAARLPIGQRHPVSTIMSLVFGLSFLAGALFSNMGFWRGGLVAGVGSTVLFLLLSFSLALIATVVQSIRYSWGRTMRVNFAKSGDAPEMLGTMPFDRRLVRNFKRVAGFLIEAWPVP